MFSKYILKLLKEKQKQDKNNSKETELINYYKMY